MLARAAELDRQARSEEALRVLEGCGDWPVPYNERGLLLRAKVLMETRGPIAALDELPDDAEAFTTHEGRLGYFFASARAYIATRNWRAAGAMLAGAESAVSEPGDSQRSLLAYLRARMRWSLREYNPNDPDLTVAARTSDIALQQHAINLRSWMHAGLQHHRGQLEDLLECLRIYAQHPDACEILGVARSLRSTLGLAWELADFEACDEASQVFEMLPWVDDVQLEQFCCLRGLAWQAFVRGDLAKSDAYQEAEIRHAPAAFKAMAHADRAYIAHLALRSDLSVYELQRAQSAADSIKWHATREDEREVLLTLAALMAPVDVLEGQRWMSLYQSLRPQSQFERIEGTHESQRLQGFRKYAEGRVQQALGNHRVAIPLLEGAHDAFIAAGHVFRAMLAAQALFEITQEERWLGATRLHAASFPNSVLSRRLYA